MHILKTERLLLRSWREEDLAPFTELNADPKVMEYLIGPLKPIRK
jgi:RimJ/RimL family protein N-acetyltransferase